MWPRPDVRALLNAAREDRLYYLFCTIIGLGLHPWQALPLQWDDFNDKTGTLKITRTYVSTGKIGFTTKRILYPEKHRTYNLTPWMFNLLMNHRHHQKAERKANHVRLNNPLMFTTKTGEPLHPDSVERAFHAICERAHVYKAPLDELRIAHMTRPFV